MKKSYVVNLLLSLCLLLACQKQDDENQHINEYINPFLTLSNDSIAFPGAVVPFGLMQLHPNTLTPTLQGEAGYLFSDSVITSFSHTHFAINGINFQDILVMPTSQSMTPSSNFDSFIPKTYATFNHKNEVVEPGYYQVKMDNDIKMELTATQRAGIYYFHFPDSLSNAMLLNLSDVQKNDTCQEACIKKRSDRVITGYRKVKNGNLYREIYYYMEFSQDVQILAGNDSAQIIEKGEKFVDSKVFAWIDFSKNTNQIMAKISISSANIEGAEANLGKEISHWSFDKVKRDAKQTWKRELSKISVSDNQNAQKALYTSLYKLYTTPLVYSDVNGNFNIADDIHSKNKDIQYTNWDLEKFSQSTFSLYTITQRYMINDLMSSLFSIYDIDEHLPLWEIWGNQSPKCGYAAIPIFTEAWQKGLIVDKNKAYEIVTRQMANECETLSAFDSLGYVPCEYPNSVHATLNYAYWNWCLSEWAKAYENDDNKYDSYISASENYRNIFNANELAFQAKTSNQKWTKDAYQQVTFAPHAITELVELYGGKENFSEQINRFQSSCQYDKQALASLYLYNYTHHQQKANFLIDSIRAQLYTHPQKEFANFDACDAPAWFVFSALGFYPLNPANGTYQLGTPLFNRVSIKIGPEKRFKITANKENEHFIYVKKVLLNGKKLNRNYITYQEIVNGGNLEFILSDKAE